MRAALHYYIEMCGRTAGRRQDSAEDQKMKCCNERGTFFRYNKHVECDSDMPRPMRAARRSGKTRNSMTEKQLRKLKRVELLEILVDQEAELEELRARLEEAEAALQNRDIRMKEAGSMAQAALQLNRIFEDADQAVQDYLAAARAMKEEQEALLERARAQFQRETDGAPVDADPGPAEEGEA